MADIKKTLKIIWDVEYDNDPKRALEVNPGESGLTYKGIYQTANPQWDGWKIIRQKMQQYNGDKKLVGEMLHDNERLNELVEQLYKKEYWDKMRLDEVKSQLIADEMMVFGINTHPITATKVAQKVVGVVQDGKIGPATLKALNRFDEELFSETYDLFEIEHYNKLVYNNPKFEKFIDGWRNRAKAI